jgi:mannose-6-phosphate isomerase-like protein (cupin superfamily)
MRYRRSSDFTAARAWEAEHIASFEDATVRLHWTDQPYRWHVNDGEEVFVVLDGVVDMRYRVEGVENAVTLEAGDIFVAGEGEQHSAYPRGQARILVIEHAGSV